MSKSLAIDIRQIGSLTDFLRNSKAHITRLKETGSPEVLTVNGKAEVVIQDAVKYQELLDRLEHAELVASLRQAMADIDDGKGIPWETLEAELNERYGV